jgi:hypothetical protein
VRRPLKRGLAWLVRRRWQLVLLFALAFVVVLLAHPGALADDVYGNIAPAPQLPPGGWVGRYPLERYSLDQYFPAISVGFTSGVDASGVAPMIAYFAAQMIWLLTSFLANGVILLFALAFNLNLLTGNGTPGSGALAPVAEAIHNLYTNTFGTPWLIAMVILVGCWAMWKALIQRQYTQTAGALAVSLLFFVVAVGIVTQPERTIGPASNLSNELSTAILSLTNEGTVSNETQAKTAASNQLFELLVLNPWTVLEFGGIEHCATVSHGKARSVAVRPLSSDPTRETQLAGELEDGTEVQTEGKTCINNRNKYAAHFLAHPFQSPGRNSEHEALEHADDEDLPETDPAKTNSTYPLSPADAPAAEAMDKGGQYQRLGLALLILAGEVGAYLLLGALAVGVILAQILLLTLLAFAPVALLIGIFPGRGHDFFRAWIAKLASYLARKVIYSLILAVVLAVCNALDDATSSLGWLLTFALQAAFLWTIFLQRNRLTTDLLAGTVGPRAAREQTNRLQTLYYATRLARMLTPHRTQNSTGNPPEPTTDTPRPTPASETPPSPGDSDTHSPPPTSDPQHGGGSPSGSAPAPEPEPPGADSAPGANETPTHGLGAPTPGARAPREPESPATHETPHTPAASTPPDQHPSPPRPQATPARPGSEPQTKGRRAAAETRHTPAGASQSPSTPVAAPPSHTPVSTGRPGAAQAYGEGTAVAVAPSPVPVPPDPTVVPVSGSGPLVEPPQLAPPPPTHERDPSAPAVAVEDPVAVLLRARRATAPTDPATQEENHA